MKASNFVFFRSRVAALLLKREQTLYTTSTTLRLPSIQRLQHQYISSSSTATTNSSSTLFSHVRSFSTAPDINNQETEFKYPKAQAVFERIVEKCHTKEEITMIGTHVLDILGKPFRKNEFYYRGFGGKRVKTEEAPPVEEVEVVEEKKVFDLRLVGFDAASKIKVIKEVRAIAGLGLKEAKDLVESAPKVISKDIPKDQAEAFKATLEAVGAQLEIV